jgi:isopenicillin-N epimerase
VPFPVESSGALAASVLDAVTPKTKLVLIDQITSPTALIFPVDRLVKELEGRGIPVLVDAAHAPGHIPLSLDATGASFTTGNLHKWVCAPKGVAFLHVRKDWQVRLRPSVISHGANSSRTDRSRFHLEFDWVGTADPTAMLCVPTALDVMGSLFPGGWPELMRRNRDACLDVRGRMLGVLGTPTPCPPDVLPAMASVIVPFEAEGLHDRLFDEFRLEIPVMRVGELTLVRVSMQQHVRERDVEALLQAFRSLSSVRV